MSRTARSTQSPDEARIPPVISSSTSGFFQEAPKITNQFYDDASYQRALNFFLPSAARGILSDLASFGERVLSPEISRWLANAEHNPPTLQTWDTWGKRKDTLITSEGWRNLQQLGIKEGIVAIAYEEEHAQQGRLYQFFKCHLWSSSSALVGCPSSMQDGAAALILRSLRAGTVEQSVKPVLESALGRLISRDPAFAWTSGQWMTERSGGSDVRATETRARYAPGVPSTLPRRASDGSALGPWQIDGFKWFSSATDADMAVLLAKTGDSDELSAFFAPTRSVDNAAKDKSQSEYNGIQIQRLKNKLGTKALPTAELVLGGMRAHLIGRVGQGTKEISTILNITRVHNAVSAMGGWGRGLAVSRAFSRVRRTNGKLLTELPAHVRGLAGQHVKYRAGLMFTFFVVSLLGMVEHANKIPDAGEVKPTSPVLPPLPQAVQLLRLLTPSLKATTALSAIDGLRFCMESLGGVGYLENDDPILNVARMYRDCNVLSIWEGTTDVMAADTIRVLKGKEGAAALNALEAWADSKCTIWSQMSRGRGTASSLVRTEVSNLKHLVQNCSTAELLYRGREIMNRLSWIVSSVVLCEDYRRDATLCASEVAGRWLGKHDGAVMRQWLGDRSWTAEAAMDKAIVLERVNVPSQFEQRTTGSRL
ncbi:MAG: hypothetical protein M1828_003391 [Chrysothrix sp. TS-e1954]|nr:MAG: hypothetical protein M1828_003391 [Chrysothrix sp. TS-e1954]